MANKFLIKKVNPHVPVFTSYVACLSTAAGAYQLPSDCVCPVYEVCVEPEICLELPNILQVNFKVPLYTINTGNPIQRIESLEFWNKYIYPYILQLEGDPDSSVYNIYFTCGSPAISDPFDITQLLQTGTNEETLVWESTYYVTEETFIDYIAAQSIGGNIKFTNFPIGCAVSIILIDEITGAVLILNNIVIVVLPDEE